MIAALVPILEASDVDLEAAGHLSSLSSFFFGVVVLLFGGAGALFAMFVLARRLAQQGARETEAIANPPPLAQGPARVVRGRVELGDGARSAVRVVVQQRVKNHTSKNSKWHTWEESGRIVDARPFYLTRAAAEGGETILVEPSDAVFVVDTIETVGVAGTVTRRDRVCEVSEGEEFSAFGTLVQGPHPRARSAYRDGGHGWILKPPRMGRMVLASGTIEARYAGRVRFLRTWGSVLALAWAVLNFFVTAPFVAATVAGEREVAQVVADREWITRGKNSTTHHYAVTVAADSGYRFEREVTSRTYYTLKARRQTTGVRVPVLHAGDWGSAAYLGSTPTMSGVGVVLGLIGSLIAAAICASAYRDAFAWYDKGKLSEHGGTGHLP